MYYAGVLNYIPSVRRIGIASPGVEIRFKDIQVSANVFIGARGMPGLTNDFRSLCENILSPILKLFGRGPEGVSALPHIMSIPPQGCLLDVTTFHYFPITIP